MPLDTVTDLLAAVARLPRPERERAQRRVSAALEQPALACRAELGLLALELSGPADRATDPTADRAVELSA